MIAKNPEDVDRMLAEAISNGDVETALALYEPEATFMAEPGKPAVGTDAIREVLKGFVALKPRLTMEKVKAVQAGDIALLYSRWSLSGTGPDGGPVNISGQGREVARRQQDGGWRFVIDDPNGGS